MRFPPFSPLLYAAVVAVSVVSMILMVSGCAPSTDCCQVVAAA